MCVSGCQGSEEGSCNRVTRWNGSFSINLTGMEIQFTTGIFKRAAHTWLTRWSWMFPPAGAAGKGPQESQRGGPAFSSGSREDGYFGTDPRRIGLRQAQSKGRQTEVHQRATRDFPTAADACQSLVLFPINSSSRCSRPRFYVRADRGRSHDIHEARRDQTNCGSKVCRAGYKTSCIGPETVSGPCQCCLVS
jgi:hypothetical protein